MSRGSRQGLRISLPGCPVPWGGNPYQPEFVSVIFVSGMTTDSLNPLNVVCLPLVKHHSASDRPKSFTNHSSDTAEDSDDERHGVEHRGA